MDERMALRLSLLCSLAGLGGLYLVSEFIEARATSTGSITIDDVGSTFMVCGNLSSGRVSKGHVFQTLNDGSAACVFQLHGRGGHGQGRGHIQPSVTALPRS